MTTNHMKAVAQSTAESLCRSVYIT